MIQTPKPDHSVKAAPHSRPGSRKSDRVLPNELFKNHMDDSFTGLPTGKSLFICDYILKIKIFILSKLLMPLLYREL